MLAIVSNAWKPCAVAAELDERVADDAVVARRRRRDRVRAAAEHERLAEAVPRERERAEAARREQVARREAQRPRAAPRRTSCSRSGRRSRAPLLVGEPERVERAHVVAASRAAAALQLRRSASACRPPAACGAVPPRRELARRASRAARRRGTGRHAVKRRRRRSDPAISVAFTDSPSAGTEGPGRLAGPSTVLWRRAVTAPRSPDAATRRTGTCPENGTSFASTPSPSRLFGLWFGSPNAAVQERAVALRERAQIDVDHVVAEPPAVREAAEVGRRATPSRSGARRAGRAAGAGAVHAGLESPCSAAADPACVVPVKLSPGTPVSRIASRSVRPVVGDRLRARRPR